MGQQRDRPHWALVESRCQSFSDMDEARMGKWSTKPESVINLRDDGGRRVRSVKASEL